MQSIDGSIALLRTQIFSFQGLFASQDFRAMPDIQAGTCGVIHMLPIVTLADYCAASLAECDSSRQVFTSASS